MKRKRKPTATIFTKAQKYEQVEKFFIERNETKITANQYARKIGVVEGSFDGWINRYCFANNIPRDASRGKKGFTDEFRIGEVVKWLKLKDLPEMNKSKFIKQNEHDYTGASLGKWITIYGEQARDAMGISEQTKTESIQTEMLDIKAPSIPESVSHETSHQEDMITIPLIFYKMLKEKSGFAA